MTDEQNLADCGDVAAVVLARRHLTDFAERLVPGFARAPHTDLVAEHLEALEARQVRRLILAMPPQHGKSTSAARALPAWWLGRRPAEHVIVASYSQQLAEGHSRAARGFLLDPRFPFPEVAVSSESAAVNRWHTVAGGGMVAAGVQGRLTGFPAHLAVADDLLSGREEADSEPIRDRAWRWFLETFLTRLQPDGAVVLIGTRWHEDDVIGRVLSSAGADAWTVLCLPALAEQNDPLGRELGEPLWPSHGFDSAWLSEQREVLGPYGWASLYQGRPAPAEGAMFKRSWLTGRYDRLPEDGLKIVSAVDASFGKNLAADYSAIATIGYDRRWFYVLDVRRGRWEFHTLMERIKQVRTELGPSVVLVEDSSAGSPAIQELRRTSGVEVVPVKAEGSKTARADSVTGLFEAGRVLWPAASPAWRDEALEEIASFPQGRNDDMVDAIVYALRRLRKSSGTGGGAVAIYSRPDGSYADTPDGVDDGRALVEIDGKDVSMPAEFLAPVVELEHDPVLVEQAKAAFERAVQREANGDKSLIAAMRSRPPMSMRHYLSKQLALEVRAGELTSERADAILDQFEPTSGGGAVALIRDGITGRESLRR